MKRKISALFVMCVLVGAGIAAPAHAGAAPEEAMSVLQKRGYTDIEIAADESPGYQARACKGGTHFSITLDRQTNIIDVDPQGSCGGDQTRDYAAAPAPEPEPIAPAPPPESHGGFKEDGYRGPVTAHTPLFDQLYRRGYYDIRVIDSDDDEIEVLACKGGRLYEIEIKRNGRIDDIDRKGRCGPRRYSGNDGTHVEAPFSGVHTRRGRVDVEAPFTGVHVGPDGVHVRAPFVDRFFPR
jgi:hypothetical protein